MILWRIAAPLALVASLAVPATAAAAWTPFQGISPAVSPPITPDLAQGSGGQVASVWQKSDGFNERIELSVRDVSGTWSPAEYVSPPLVTAIDPHVAVDSDGDVVVVWRQSDGSNSIVRVRERSAAGVLGPVQKVSGRGRDAFDARVAMMGDDTAVLAWTRFGATGPKRMQIRKRLEGGALGTVVTLPGGGQGAETPALAVAPSDAMVLAWRNDDGRIAFWWQKTTGTSTSSTWGTLSAGGQEAIEPDVAIGPSGDATIVWSRFDGAHWRGQARTVSPTVSAAVTTFTAAGADVRDVHVADAGSSGALLAYRRFDGTNWRVHVQRRAADGAWSAGQLLSVQGHDAMDPRLGVDASGNAVVSWRQFNGSHWDVLTRRRNADGSLVPLRALSSFGHDAADPRIVVDGPGNAVVAWRSTQGPGVTWMYARRRAASGTLGPAATIGGGTTDTRETRVAASADGSAVFAWRRWTGTQWRLEARRRASGGSLGPVTDIGEGDLDEARLKVVADDDGDALFVWQRAPVPSGYPGILARTWDASSGTLSPTRVVTASGRRPDVVMDGAGNAWIAWENHTDHSLIRARPLSAAGVLGPAETISLPGDGAHGARLALAPAGRIVFAWQSILGLGAEPISARARAADGALSPVRIVSPAGVAGAPDLAVESDGDAVLTWHRQESGGGDFVAETRMLKADGTLDATITSLAAAGLDATRPQVVISNAGEAVFAWLAEDGSGARWVQTRIRTFGTFGSVFDVSSPSIFVESGPALAMTPSGTAVYAWDRYAAPFVKVVEARSRLSTGAASPIAMLSNPAFDSGGPSLATDGLNRAFAIWAGRENGPVRAQIALGP